MSRLNKRENSGVSSVFGSVLILLLVLTLSSALFLSLYLYEEKSQESITLEEERVQEKITLLSLSTENVSGTEYLRALFVNNTGTITSRIRAVYIDSIFVCDPANPTLNPNGTYINPKDSVWVQIPNNLKYSPLSKIEVATERGMKSIEYEWRLKSGSQAEPPSETQRANFGPLLLDFDKFYYTENSGSYDPNSWKPGWSVEKGTTLVWKITVTNVDDRDLTINKYSGFTLVSNDGGVQKPWFIEPPNGLDTLYIPSNSAVDLVYIWDRPRLTQGVTNQSVYNQNDRSKVFLTFFGIFHEHDGSTKPYGQTIPFEAVLIRDPLMLITANPTTIAVGSKMTSTITATVRDIMGILAANAPVTFTTTLGIPSSYETTTNPNGIATFVLSPGSEPGTALVTATSGGVSKSTSVVIAYGTLSLSATPSTVAAGSTMISTITARLTVNGSPISGETVTFTTDATTAQGTLSSTTAITNAQGYATITFSPGTETGIATITATWGGKTQSIPVTIASWDLSLTPNPQIIAAASTMNSTIMVVLNLDGAAVPNALLNIAVNMGTLSSNTVTTNSVGQANVSLLPGSTTGDATVTFTWQGLSEQAIVTIAEGTTSVQTNATIIIANSTDTAQITATILLDGVVVPKVQVTFETTLGTLSANSDLTDDFGVASVTLSPGTTTGEAIVTAKWQNITGVANVTIGA